MQKQKARSEVRVKAIIPVEHLRLIMAVRDATGEDPSRLFVEALDRIEDDFWFEDEPLSETGTLNLYLDLSNKRKLDRLSRNKKVSRAAIIRAVIAHELGRNSASNKT